MNWINDFGTCLVKSIIKENERLLQDHDEISVKFEKNIPELTVTNGNDAVLNIVYGQSALILWQLLTGIEVYEENNKFYDDLENRG